MEAREKETWMVMNLISLSIDKTKMMVIGKDSQRDKLMGDRRLQIKMVDKNMEQVLRDHPG